jgi:Xaa-Pro aminopeptidase
VEEAISHYNKNDQPLNKNEYSSDITRTYPVSGIYTENQKLIYQMVLNTKKCYI